jgi:hypothetical protein
MKEGKKREWDTQRENRERWGKRERKREIHIGEIERGGKERWWRRGRKGSVSEWDERKCEGIMKEGRYIKRLEIKQREDTQNVESCSMRREKQRETEM